MSIVVDIHVLQTLPPNNINRDDTGAPKSATFGGVPRQRVSSQAWKRAVRKDFSNYLDPQQLGFRTRRVVEKITYRAEELDTKDQDTKWSKDQLEQTAAIVSEILNKAGIKTDKLKESKAEEPAEDQPNFARTSYLLFLSDQQITNVAQAILNESEQKWTKKLATELLDVDHSVDIAMFGRMIADAADYNVDASVQVAHAIGVSASEPEFDYFTAVDDAIEASDEETGAGMIGTVQMSSSTLYRFATVNVRALAANLGDDNVAVESTAAFVKAFLTSLPSGKQNTFANNTLPEAVVVRLRTDRSISLVNAFEEPVPLEIEGGRRLEAAKKLVIEAQSIDYMYDMAPHASWVMGTADLTEVLADVGKQVNLTELTNELKTELAELV